MYQGLHTFTNFRTLTMVGQLNGTAPARLDTSLDYDVLIIGAGQSGMYSLHRMRQLGLKTRVLEAGSGEGGTWFW